MEEMAAYLLICRSTPVAVVLRMAGPSLSAEGRCCGSLMSSLPAGTLTPGAGGPCCQAAFMPSRSRGAGRQAVLFSSKGRSPDALTITANSNQTLAGTIATVPATNLRLEKFGGGALTLTTRHSHTGGTNIYGGALVLSGAGTLGAVGLPVDINGVGSTLDLNGTCKRSATSRLGMRPLSPITERASPSWARDRLLERGLHQRRHLPECLVKERGHRLCHSFARQLSPRTHGGGGRHARARYDLRQWAGHPGIL